jgi:hypothetical protein
MLAELRLILHEDTAADSFWTDAELLAYFNQAMDLRVMEMADAHEGWMTDPYTADLVAGQVNYTLPEGAGRVKRVLIVVTSGSTTREYPLRRNQRWSQAATTTNTSGLDCLPTYRLMGEMLYLDPPYGKAVTGGLKIEVEAAPARLTAGSSTLAQRFPDVAESLLIYDTALIALAVEGSQGELPDGYVHHIRTVRAEYERKWKEYIESRTMGRSFSPGLYLGD